MDIGRWLLKFVPAVLPVFAPSNAVAESGSWDAIPEGVMEDDAPKKRVARRDIDDDAFDGRREVSFVATEQSAVRSDSATTRKPKFKAKAEEGSGSRTTLRLSATIGSYWNSMPVTGDTAKFFGLEVSPSFIGGGWFVFTPFVGAGKSDPIAGKHRFTYWVGTGLFLQAPEELRWGVEYMFQGFMAGDGGNLMYAQSYGPAIHYFMARDPGKHASPGIGVRVFYSIMKVRDAKGFVEQQNIHPELLFSYEFRSHLPRTTLSERGSCYILQYVRSNHQKKYSCRSIRRDCIEG